MEDLFNGLKYGDLINRITDEVRKEAQFVPRFNAGNGCIEVILIPLREEVDDWLGGVGKFGAAEIPTVQYGFTQKIDRHGSYTIDYVCEDQHVEPVNCFGYVHAKIAYAMRRFGLIRAGREAELEKDAETGYYVEENGYSMHKGAVCVTVSIKGRGTTELMHIWIGVSGADERDDERCAKTGTHGVEAFFRENSRLPFHFKQFI